MRGAGPGGAERGGHAPARPGADEDRAGGLSDRPRLRAATIADAAAIAAIYAPYIEGTISFETVAPDAAAIAARIAAGGDAYPWLVAEVGGAVAGYAYAQPFGQRQAYRWTVETAIYLEVDRRAGGLGRHLYGALLGTLTAQGFAQALGRVSLPNPPSEALHAAMGFREVGRLPGSGWKGRWIDVAIWQRALAPVVDPAATPAEPLSLSAVAQRAER